MIYAPRVRKILIAVLVGALLGFPVGAGADDDAGDPPVAQVVETTQAADPPADGEGPAADPAPVPDEPAPAVEAAVETDPAPEPVPDAEPQPECTVTAVTAGTKDVGAATSIWGSLSNCDTSAVTVQILVGGSWEQAGEGTASATGYYAVPLTRDAGVVGTQTYRAKVVEGDGSEHTSPSVTLTRVASVTATGVGTKPVGERTYAWGRVSGAPGSSVWTEVYLGGGWSRSQTSVADGTGWYTLELTYGMNTAGQYRFRVGAATPAGTVYSDDVTLTRTAVVSAASAGTKLVGLTTSAWGRVSGAPNASVWTEVYISGRWSRSQTSRADSTGWYTIPLTYGINTPGTYQYRVGASTAVGTVYSPTFTLTRTSFRVDSRCMTGRAFCASKDQRKMAWMIDGRIIEIIDVRFGAPAYPTRNGAFEIYWKNADHVSSIYNVSMPYAMFFSGGQAIHYSADFNRVGYVGGSHGCINVGSLSTAARIFNAARVGDKVIVYN